MGLPIVATDIRGCRQVVEEGVTGLLVPVCDVDVLATALERLAQNPRLRTQFGRDGRRMATERFDVRNQIETTLKIYTGGPRRSG